VNLNVNVNLNEFLFDIQTQFLPEAGEEKTVVGAGINQSQQFRGFFLELSGDADGGTGSFLAVRKSF